LSQIKASSTLSSKIHWIRHPQTATNSICWTPLQLMTANTFAKVLGFCEGDSSVRASYLNFSHQRSPTHIMTNSRRF
jgi:hypothetical protein